MSSKNNKTLVMKFGGTSVGSIEAINQVIGIVENAKNEWQNVIVVVSAFSGITNLLTNSAKSAAKGDLSPHFETLKSLHQRHEEAVDHFVKELATNSQVKQEINHLIDSYNNLIQAISVLGEASPRAMDTVTALGERICVRVIAAALASANLPARFVESTQLIQTDEHFQAAVPDMEATQRKTQMVLKPILNNGQIPIVTGFIGATESGITTTLGRGGSDYSAAILGVALPANEVWIWTDVDGVMTADPRLEKNARTIPELSYREVAELAYFGAKVLHPKSIRPVIEADITLKVRNTFNPEHPGTVLRSEQIKPANGGIIKAVTAFRGIQLITVEGRGMLGVPGVAARIFSAVATTGATVPLITEASSEQSLCFAVPVESTEEVLRVLNETFTEEIRKRNFDRIWATEEVVIVTVVCPKMQHTLGIAGKVFSALGDSGVNVQAIAHGSSEVSISLVVSVDDLQKTINALHELTA
jgi:aspartate kinase